MLIGGFMKHLLSHAAQLGVSVHVAHLPRPYRGWYDSAARRIVYDFDLTPAEQVSVLAHELGHAFHDHQCEGDVDAERRADIYAAELLIHPDQYAQLERINPDRHFIADELGVTVDVVHTFAEHCLTPMRGVTYSRPRHGFGQWRYRGIRVAEGA